MCFRKRVLIGESVITEYQTHINGRPDGIPFTTSSYSFKCGNNDVGQDERLSYSH